MYNIVAGDFWHSIIYRVFSGAASFISGGGGATGGVGVAMNVAAAVDGSVIIVAVSNSVVANISSSGVVVISNITTVVDVAVSNIMVVAVAQDSEAVIMW